MHNDALILTCGYIAGLATAGFVLAMIYLTKRMKNDMLRELQEADDLYLIENQIQDCR